MTTVPVCGAHRPETRTVRESRTGKMEIPSKGSTGTPESASLNHRPRFQSARRAMRAARDARFAGSGNRAILARVTIGPLPVP